MGPPILQVELMLEDPESKPSKIEEVLDGIK